MSSMSSTPDTPDTPNTSDTPPSEPPGSSMPSPQQPSSPHLYRVGEPYVPGRTRWPETAEYNYRQGQHELRLFLSRLSERDIQAVRRGPAEFALVVEPPVLFFLYRFEPALDWSDAPYSWHLLPPAQRTLPPALQDQQHALLSIILVSADDGLIRGLRVVSLAPSFTAALHRAIREQAAAPFDPQAYDRALAQLYQRYPTTTALLARAIARTRGGA